MLETALKSNRDLLWVEEELTQIKLAANPAWSPESDCIVGKRESKDHYLCFSKKTGLLIGKGNSSEYRILKDWRDVGGLKIPYELRHFKNGSKNYFIKLNEVILNKKISNEIFEIPLQGPHDGMPDIMV